MLFIIDCVHTYHAAPLHSLSPPPALTTRDLDPGRRRHEGRGTCSPEDAQGTCTRGSTLAISMAGKAQLVAAGGGYRLPSRSWS